MISSKFDITDIEVVGCYYIQEGFIEEQLDYLQGKNIFFIRSSEVKSEIEVVSPYIKSIRVEKFLPGSIRIYLEEREPYLLWSNLSGIYLLDSEGYVLEFVKDFKDLEIAEEDIDLLKGYGDLTEYEVVEEKEEGENDENNNEGDSIDSEKPTQENGDPVDLSEEEEVGTKESESEDKLTTEEKYELVDEERMEISLRVDKFWNDGVRDIPEKYNKYPFVYSYEKKDYDILEQLDQSIVKSTRLGLGIDFLDEDVTRYIWESEFRFVVYLKRTQKIVFSTRRNFQDQVDNLKVLIDKLKLEGKKFKYIDLSSDIIVYEID